MFLSVSFRLVLVGLFGSSSADFYVKSAAVKTTDHGNRKSATPSCSVAASQRSDSSLRLDHQPRPGTVNYHTTPQETQ